MALDRYSRTPRINLGRTWGTQRSMYPIYIAVKEGMIASRRYVTVERDRLDIIAGKEYGDGRLWWVIAAASGIGWSMQLPSGIVLEIPTDLGQVEGIVG